MSFKVHIFFTYLVSVSGLKIQGTYYENYGILIEPSSYATHPLTFAYFTYNIIFDHPFMNIKSVDQCNSTNSYMMKLETFTSTYYSEVKNLLTSTNPLELLPICKNNPVICTNANDNPTQDVTTLRRDKRFLPFLALAAGISALGLSFYNTFSQNQVNTAIDDLNRNQQKILSQLNTQNKQINLLIDTEKTIYTKLEMFERALDHLIETDICNIKSEISYLYFLSKLQELHAKYERIINMIFLGKLSSDIIDPLSLKHILQSHNLLKKSVISDDITLAYRLTQLIPLGIINNHMGISVLLRIPVIEMQDISPIFSVTNVGWYNNDHYERFKIPNEFYLLSEGKDLYALEIDSNACHQVSNLWICDHASHKTNEKTSCISSLINKKDVVASTCVSEALKILPSNILEVRSGLLVSGYHEINLLKNIRTKLTVSSKSVHDKMNFTFFAYGGDISYSVDGVIYNSVQDPITVYINPTIFNYFSGLDELPQELQNKEWKDLSDLKDQTSRLQKSKHESLILQYPVLLTTSSVLIYVGIILLVIVGAICCLKQRHTCRKPAASDIEVESMRSLMGKPSP